MATPSLIDTLDDLEIKINHLQKRIIGTEVIRLENNLTIEEILTQSNTAIKEAVSSHNNIQNIFKRKEALEKYLDPTFWDSFVDTVTKTQLVLESQEELRDTIEQLKQLNELVNYSNNECFQNITTNKKDMLMYSQNVLELQEKSNKLKAAVRLLMTKYINIINYTNQVLFQLNIKIAEIEDELEEVKPLD